MMNKSSLLRQNSFDGIYQLTVGRISDVLLVKFGFLNETGAISPDTIQGIKITSFYHRSALLIYYTTITLATASSFQNGLKVTRLDTNQSQILSYKDSTTYEFAHQSTPFIQEADVGKTL